jgi:uncharacterized membrane protein
LLAIVIMDFSSIIFCNQLQYITWPIAFYVVTQGNDLDSYYFVYIHKRHKLVGVQILQITQCTHETKKVDWTMKNAHN